MSAHGSAANPPRSDAAPEERERESAWRRSEAAEAGRTGGGFSQRGSCTGRARASVAARAFAALAENVRDYAVFLMNPQGVITFWGGAAARRRISPRTHLRCPAARSRAALEVLAQFLAVAERLSIASFRDATPASGGEGEPPAGPRASE